MQDWRRDEHLTCINDSLKQVIQYQFIRSERQMRPMLFRARRKRHNYQRGRQCISRLFPGQITQPGTSQRDPW